MATWQYLGPDEVDPIPHEWVWERLRNWRNLLLSETDWTQITDAPVDKAAWAAYRQALRDLPANTSDPREVVWPTSPQ